MPLCPYPKPVADVADGEVAADDKHAALIASRSGAVLGPHTVLKEDHFLGCQSPKLPALFPGAPNFREVPGLAVCGVAISTLEGMQQVLAHVGAAPGTRNKDGEEVRQRVVHAPGSCWQWLCFLSCKARALCVARLC